MAKTGITAEILADSVNAVNGRRLTTFLLRYHRYVHSELLTHRVFERNSASSRAVPTRRMLLDVLRDPAVPLRWGKANKGMQDAGPLPRSAAAACRALWLLARYPVLAVVWLLLKFGLAKQVANRLLEPWCWMTVVLTGTEWVNFYRLRRHKDAQPEMDELARRMLAAHALSRPRLLQPGDWHLPFWRDDDERRLDDASGQYGREAWPEHQLAVCTARCARTSYANFFGKDDPGEDVKLHDRLRASGHHSPFGHCARAERDDAFFANLRGFAPYRKVLGDDTHDGDAPFDPVALAKELGVTRAH